MKIAATLLTAPVQRTFATDPYYRPPTLEQALSYQMNESKTGVRMVAMRDLPSERLQGIVTVAEQAEQRYGHRAFRFRKECAAVVLQSRGRSAP